MSRRPGKAVEGELATRTSWAIAAVIVAGVILRLLVAGSVGFPSDVGTFMAWAERLASVGPGRFYAPGYFSDYPPGFLYVLWLLGALFDGEALRLAVKTISIPADVGIALLAAALVRRHAGDAAAIAAAALWMLQPAPIFAGPYWGQVDAVGTLPFLGALLAAGRRRWALAGVLAATATITKPQFALVLGVVTVAAAFEFIRDADWRPALRAVGAAALTLIVLAWPFGLTPAAAMELVRGASETYQYTSLYAFNVWAVVGDFWKPDEPYVVFGAVLLVGGLVASVVPLWWRRDTPALLAAGAATVMAFYFLPTRAHERYLFPAIALLLPLAISRRRLLLPYLVLAGGFFVTLYFAFTRYQQNDLHAPPWLDATLFGRTGQNAIAIAMLGAAALIGWRLLRGEARLEPTLDVRGLVPLTVPVATRRPTPARAAPEGRRPGWAPPAGLALGGAPARRDLLVALLVALTVLLTRGYRLDQPRDMYFDEVYHARTAFELLAQRAPYEWTHPPLAKELMALGILAFANERVSGSEAAPKDVVAFAVDGDGTRAYARADGTVELRDRDGANGRGIGRVDGTPRALAIDAGRVLIATDRALTELPAGSTRSLSASPTALVISAGRVIVGSAGGTTIFPPAGAPAVSVTTPAVGVAARPDGSELYLLAPDGTVHVVDPGSGNELRMYPSLARERAIAFAQGPHVIILARADEPVLDTIDAEDGHRDLVALANGRTGTFASGATALAVVPRTDFLYALVDGHAVVVESHGGAAFASIPTAATMLGVDGPADTLVLLGPSGADRVDTGRNAFAWRLPGVIAGALLAFFLVLLARRLFASRLVPALVGIVVILDGSMFAQARIGMNDSYVAAFIVAGWYFIVAAHRPRRWAWADILLAGAFLGLGAASKWAAFYTLAGVLVAAIAVTVLAYRRGAPGTGGPLDLLAGYGRNAALLFVAFAVVPVGVYLASYASWFGGPMTPYTWDLVDLTKQMYWYHSGLTAPHAAASPWWSWPILLKPVYWYYAPSEGSSTALIYDAGNVVLFWGALVATVWCAVTAVRTRSIGLGFVVFALLAQYVAWIPISRVLFFYHFFTALPFYLLALACGLAYLWETGRARAAIAFLAAATAAFVFFYPFVSGEPVRADQAAMFFVLPTWQYECQFYPSFVCPLGHPVVPAAAIVGRLGLSAVVALLAAGAFAWWRWRGPAALPTLGRRGRGG